MMIEKGTPLVVWAFESKDPRRLPSANWLERGAAFGVPNFPEDTAAKVAQ